MLTLASICVATLLASFVGSLIGCALGGLGVSRAALRSTRELESDLLSLEERVSRDQKKRAGQQTQISREERIAEAHRIAATTQAQTAQANFLPGRIQRH